MAVPGVQPGVPLLVTSVYGAIVAAVSAVFGISAHGLAAGSGATLPPFSVFALAMLACLGVGVLTSELARRFSPLLTALAGLLAGQGLVHLILSSQHSGHASAASAGNATIAAPHHGGAGLDATQAEALRSAMDTAAGPWHQLSPTMAGAHLVAIAVTALILLALATTLNWVAARVEGLSRLSMPGASTAVLVQATRRSNPTTLYLLSRGGTRAPPVFV